MKKFNSFLKVVLPLGIGLLFIYLSFNGTSEEERKLIFSYIQGADLRIVLLSVCFGILSHLSRAYRWKYLLAPLGYKPRFINSVLAVLILYRKPESHAREKFLGPPLWYYDKIPTSHL